MSIELLIFFQFNYYKWQFNCSKLIMGIKIIFSSKYGRGWADRAEAQPILIIKEPYPDRLIFTQARSSPYPAH